MLTCDIFSAVKIVHSMINAPNNIHMVTLIKDAVQSDLRMCTKVFISFYVLAKLDCCLLIIYYTLES
jgi:hypothetical protein